MLGATQLENSFAEKYPGVLVDTKLNTHHQQGAPAQRQLMANGIPSCIRQSMASRWRGDPSPPHSAGEATPGVLRPVLGPQHKGGMDILGRVQRRSAGTMKGLGHLSCKEGRENWDCSARRRGGSAGISSVYINT